MAPEHETEPADDTVPTAVPPYEEAPSSTGVVVEGDDDDGT